MNKRLLLFAAFAEAATGATLMLAPSLVGRLLLGAEMSGVATPIARVTGIALISLGVACLPCCTALCGMLTYSALATLYLAWLALDGKWVGTLLWPAVAAHGVLTLLLSRGWLNQRREKLKGSQKNAADAK